MAYTRVLIIGGGFGGITAAQSLNRAKLEVLLIDKTNHYLFQPLLYQVATAALSPADIAAPIRGILAKQKNASVVMGDVVSIDKMNKHVTLADGDVIGYDYLIISTGAKHSYFDHKEWEPLAPGIKTLADALKIREKILLAYEKAERCDSFKESQKYLRFAIIGGGPTGVELAGALGEIAHQTMSKNFRKIKPEHTKIYLIEGASQILGAYPPSLAKKAQKGLEKLGVRVLVNKQVTNITEEGVFIKDEFIPTRNVIWAAGIQASPLLETLQIPLDKQGRAIVNPDLSIPVHPEVFVIGDAAHCKDKEGKVLPGVAPVAVQQGRYVAKIIRNAIPKDKRTPFWYWDKGSMATIGRAKAVALIGKLQISGFFAWLAWSMIHIVYLINFRHKIIVMMEWLFWYLTGFRNVRLINRGIDELEKK